MFKRLIQRTFERQATQSAREIERGNVFAVVAFLGVEHSVLVLCEFDVAGHWVIRQIVSAKAIQFSHHAAKFFAICRCEVRARW